MKINQENLIQVMQSVVDISKDVNVESKFSDLGFDSMDHAAIILEIEEKFKVSINNDSYGELNSIKDILTFLNK
jgi:acyl carrier protein